MRRREMAARTFRGRHRYARKMTEEEGNAFEEQSHERGLALKLKAKKLRERLRPAGRFSFKHTQDKGKTRLLEIDDFWETECDTIE
jgi:hypothetical protein